MRYETCHHCLSREPFYKEQLYWDRECGVDRARYTCKACSENPKGRKRTTADLMREAEEGDHDHSLTWKQRVKTWWV